MPLRICNLQNVVHNIECKQDWVLYMSGIHYCSNRLRALTVLPHNETTKKNQPATENSKTDDLAQWIFSAFGGQQTATLFSADNVGGQCRRVEPLISSTH